MDLKLRYSQVTLVSILKFSCPNWQSIIIFQTPLNEALKRNYQNIVELLLRKGAKIDVPEVDAKGEMFNPLDIANDHQKNILLKYVVKSLT